MSTRNYQHSAYWFAKKQGWTRDEARSYALDYLQMHQSVARQTRRKRRKVQSLANPTAWLDDAAFGYEVNPVLLGACLMADIGQAMRTTVRNLLDPVERDAMKKSFLHDLRTLRRPFYYERETKRRRLLAAERRKITRRQTTAPQPSPEDVLKAWNARKESKEKMIILGGMMHDLECYVDNCLKIDEHGNVVGRNSGIKGWLKTCLPELFPKYKTLMRYKAMAIRLRQATETKDPVPTAALLTAKPRHSILSEILKDFRNTFSFLMEAIDYHLDPVTVLVAREDVLRAGKAKKSKPAMKNTRTTSKKNE